MNLKYEPASEPLRISTPAPSGRSRVVVLRLTCGSDTKIKIIFFLHLSDRYYLPGPGKGEFTTWEPRVIVKAHRLVSLNSRLESNKEEEEVVVFSSNRASWGAGSLSNIQGYLAHKKPPPPPGPP